MTEIHVLYKGFKAVSHPDGPGILNIMYIREDGTLACCAQCYTVTDFYARVDQILEQPLPSWMTGKK